MKAILVDWCEGALFVGGYEPARIRGDKEIELNEAVPPQTLRLPWFSHIAPLEERWDEFDDGMRFGQSTYTLAEVRADGVAIYR